MNWEDELKKKWYLHHYNKEQEYYVTIEEDIIAFIHSLLKQQRDENELLKTFLIDATGHFNKTFSTRPCETCDYVSKLIKRPYGCKRLNAPEPTGVDITWSLKNPTGDKK